MLIPSASADLISFIDSKTKSNRTANWISTFPFPKASPISARQQQQALYFSTLPPLEEAHSRSTASAEA